MVNNLCHQIHQKHVLNMRSSFWASINDLHLNKEAGHGMLIIGSSFGKVHVSCKKRSLQFSLVECHPDLVLVSLHAWAPDTQTTSERAVSLSQQASRDLNRKDILQKDQVIFWLWSLRFLVYNQAASKCISTFPLALAFHEAFDVLCSGQCRTKPCENWVPQSNELIRIPSRLAAFFSALIRRHLRCHWPITIDAESRMNQSECQVSWLNFPTLWFKNIFVAKRGKSQLFLFTRPPINRKSDTIFYSFTSDLK